MAKAKKRDEMMMVARTGTRASVLLQAGWAMAGEAEERPMRWWDRAELYST